MTTTYKPSKTGIRFDRLNDLIRALRAYRTTFTMECYVLKSGHPHYPCGSPACVLGHYATKFPRRGLYLSRNGGLWARGRGVEDFPIVYDSTVVCDHFGITDVDANNLFSPWGCGGAKNRREAIRYIKEFIRDNGGEAIK